MTLFKQIIRNLNIDYVVTDKNDNIKYSNSKMSGEKVLTIIKDGKKREDNIVKYEEKYYQIGCTEDEKVRVYYIQDVSIMENKYRSLRIDSLTQLYNRAVALPLIDEYILNAVGLHEPFSIIMGDIDFFKAVNDTYGHDEGDKTLKDVAKIILHSFRTRDAIFVKAVQEKRKNGNEKPKDVICRYGGEEFLILLKNITMENTLKRINEVREKIEANTNVTMSFGVVNITEEDYSRELFAETAEATRENIVKICDKCLYHSKDNGRNITSYYKNGEIKIFSPNTPTIPDEIKLRLGK